jgi:hypothetical protein
MFAAISDLLAASAHATPQDCALRQPSQGIIKSVGDPARAAASRPAAGARRSNAKPRYAIRARTGAEGRALIGIMAARLDAYLPVELLRKKFRNGREIGWRPH